MEAKSATRVRGYPDKQAEDIHTRWAWVEPSVWSERMLAAPQRASLDERPLIGEPYAGEPHLRFGGRGGATQCAFPTPINYLRNMQRT